MGKLNARKVETAGPGKHGDGDGLTLVVAQSGSRRWFLRYQLRGKRRDMGLGGYPEVSLSDARAAAAAARSLAAKGSDPLVAREAVRKNSEPIPTFREIAQEVIEAVSKRAASPKLAKQWQRYLGPSYCAPLQDRAVNEITTSDVVAVLSPVWHAKPEAARKAYAALRRVFEAARITLRDKHGIVADNPARWEDVKAKFVEAPKKLTRGSHPSLPYPQMPEFMSALRERDAIAARLLEFMILTNVRSKSAREATWDQFDIEAGLWFVPLPQLKDRAHRKEVFRIPLSPRAVEILREMESARVSDFVFPNAKGEPFTDMATVALLKRMNKDREWADPIQKKLAVTHGFRATFRTWAEENTPFAHHTKEEAMGHKVGTAVERVYRRTDLLEERRKLMNAWAAHCEPTNSENVLNFRKLITA